MIDHSDNSSRKLTSSEIIFDKFWIIFISFSLLLSLALTILMKFSIVEKWIPTSTALADYINVIIGLPIVLSSSLVAIVLARRAFDISKKQNDKEINWYSEQCALEAAELYWNISNSIININKDFLILSKHIEQTEIAHNLTEAIYDREQNVNKVLEEARLQTQTSFKILNDEFKNGINNKDKKYLL